MFHCSLHTVIQDHDFTNELYHAFEMQMDCDGDRTFQTPEM